LFDAIVQAFNSIKVKDVLEPDVQGDPTTSEAGTLLYFW